MTLRAAFPAICADLLREGRSVRFKASGWSMEPAIRDGDLITVVPLSPEDISTGDVVFYLAERGPTAHRAVSWGSDGVLLVRGDAVGSGEERVPGSSVLGKVGAVHRAETSTFGLETLIRAAIWLLRLAERTALWVRGGCDARL